MLDINTIFAEKKDRILSSFYNLQLKDDDFLTKYHKYIIDELSDLNLEQNTICAKFVYNNVDNFNSQLEKEKTKHNLSLQWYKIIYDCDMLIRKARTKEDTDNFMKYRELLTQLDTLQCINCGYNQKDCNYGKMVDDKYYCYLCNQLS